MPKVPRVILDYAAAGWPIAPVWPPASSPRRRWIRRRRATHASACTCPEQSACQTPGAHLAGDSITDPARVRNLWADRRWNVALQTGQVVDVIEAGVALGAQATRVLERQPSPYPPVAHTATGRWLFVVQVCTKPPELPERAIWHGAGAGVLVPPSREASGRDQWVWGPKHTKPSPASRVVAALQAVELNDWEVGADDFPERDDRRPLGPMPTGATE